MEDLNIRHFKLMNGDEIVGLVSVKNNDSWIIERPVVITNNLMGGYSFQPWFPFSEAKTFKVLKDHIIQHVPIAEVVKETYLQFALKMAEPTKSVDPRTDQELLEEYEQELVDKYSAEGVPLDEKPKKVIH